MNHNDRKLLVPHDSVIKAIVVYNIAAPLTSVAGLSPLLGGCDEPATAEASVVPVTPEASVVTVVPKPHATVG